MAGHDEDRAGRMSHHVLGRASHQDMFETGRTVSGSDDQVHVVVDRSGANLLTGVPYLH